MNCLERRSNWRTAARMPLTLCENGVAAANDLDFGARTLLNPEF